MRRQQSCFAFVAAAVLGVLPASAATAEPVRVRVEVRSGHAVEVELVAQPLVGDASRESPATITRRLRAPGTAELDLSTGISWRLSARAAGYWSRPEIVPPSEPSRSIRLTLLPTAEVRGAVAVTKGETIPDEVTLRFEGAERTSEPLPREILRCPIRDDRWTCRVPAGTVDLRFRAPGFVSHYFWGVDLEPGARVDLGRLVLRRGASLVGRVEVEASEPLSAPPRLTLERRMAGRSGPVMEQRVERLAASATPGPGGFFHFEGVPAGEYLLRASLDGFAPAEHPVRIFENAESALNDPLVLRPPVPLEIYLDPPLAPDGEPWYLELARLGETPRSLDVVTDRPEPADPGYWRMEGLAPGSYMVRVLTSGGQGYAVTEIDLDDATAPMTIEIPFVSVEGRLLLGDDPLAAEISFGGKHGMVKVAMTADEEGRFSGVLPRPGSWRVDVEGREPRVFRRLEDVEVDGEPSGRPARLEIRLPSGRVVGEVVAEDGEPVSSAIVEVVSTAFEELPSDIRAQTDGTFEMSGLEPGLYLVTARADGAASDPIHTHVAEKSPGRVRLVLRERIELSGVVVSSSGGVPAARVTAKPVVGETVPVGVPSSVTDVEGRFTHEIPAWVSEVILTVFPPGFDLTHARVPVEAGEPVTIPVGQHGGTLHLHWGDAPAESGESGLPPVVFDTDRLPWSLDTLEQWSAAVGGHRSGAAERVDRLTVPRIAPGTYALCWFADLAEFSLARAAGRWPAERCDQGTLVPHGELSLSVRRPD